MRYMFLKFCGRCGTEKPKYEFNKNKSKSDGLATMCKCCNKEYQKSYYFENSKQHKATAKVNKKKYVERNRNFVREYLLNNPCVDCGFSDIRALQFDHIDMVGSKSKRVTYFMDHSLENLKREISKCQIRCANCHFIRTREQMGWDWL